VRNTLLALMFVFSVPLHAKDDGKLVFNLNYSDTCRSVSATYFAHARHAKGTRGGSLNENTFGYAGNCYHDSKNLYTLVGALENSQRGNTFLVGPGVRFRSPPFLNLSVEGGLELPFVYYEIPKRQAYAYGFLPVVYVGLSLTPPMVYGMKLGTFEFGQRTFGQRSETIKLYAIGWRQEF
jgi:hypothetical protein